MQRTAQFTQGIPQFPHFTCRHYDSAHPFLAIHSADERRMIYSFSNTTSYSTFHAFFFSFRIILWPMWLANSKRQPCFYPPWSHAQEDKQNWQTWWETCAVPENKHFNFSCSLFNLECMGPLRRYVRILPVAACPWLRNACTSVQNYTMAYLKCYLKCTTSPEVTLNIRWWQ